MKLHIKITFIGVLLSFGVSSCLKQEVFPSEPELTFISFTKISADSAVFSFSFVDGDGDVGFEASDTARNLFLEYYERMNGEWVPGTSDPASNNAPTSPQIVFEYKIKNITPTGQNKLLKGQIEVFIEPFYHNPNSNWNDTIQWRAYLYDRAQNKSNIIESDMILIP